MNRIYYLFFIFLLIKLSFHLPEINQVVFLNPQTNSAIIQCPLDFIHSLDIQWYDVINQRYELNRGRYYRIHGLQPFDRQLICSSISKNETYKIQIRIYDRPLPVQYMTVSERTNTSLTILWKDDNYNRNANITFYELILKYNNIIQSRILINNTISIYKFSSLYSNTFYSIDISVIDIWKRYSHSRTITDQTLPLNSNEKILFNQIIDHYLLDQSISCYYFNSQFLLIEFNPSKFEMLNHIYNLTIYDNQNHILLTDNLYQNSFIYYLNEKNLKYKIKLIISAIQSEYLGQISKDCKDFYPIYSPLICSIKLINRNKYYLMIHMQLYNYNKHITKLKPNYIFYPKNQSFFIKKNIYDIHQYITDNIIMDIKENYSIIVENNFINEKLNISILCSINRTVPTSRMSNGIMIGLVLLIISLITLVVLIVYQKGLMFNCRRRLHPYIHSFHKDYRTKLCSGSMNENHTMEKFDSISIPIDQFALHVSNMHKDNDFGFIQLFENICESSKMSTFSADIAQMEYNKSKNRYMNILAYDHSRVKLSTDEKDGKGSYINANYVDGYEKTNAYIATQGPMINTMNDFWRMIWEKDVSVLVMITNIEERGRIKCDVYWPQEGTEIYGNIEVTLISTTSLAYYIKRIFSIRCITNEKFIDYERLVYQFHYTDWPDHGVPIFPLSVLSFIRHSSACNSEIGGPIVVHCSAGIGRTGTYIVIDTMLKKLNDQQSLNIPSFLKHIRQQRNNLVQTEEQFIFIYDVLLEVVELLSIGYKNLELNKQNLDSIIQMLDYYDQNSNLTRIEKQFQLILSSTYNYRLLPSNSGPVLVKQTGERYINASYIHGYYRIDEFIITQHPMMNTRIDFWQMIWNNNTTIIVSLYADEKLQVNSSDLPDYWPLLNEIIDCENFNVCLIDEYFECEYIYRDCLLRSTKENYELRVKIISSSYWPETCTPIKTSFNLINLIKNLNSNRPIVVHDHFGRHRAATFCMLYTMNEQIENEGILNVYELAKFYHIKRPGIWRHNGDLLFLYRCAEILFHENQSSVLPL